MNALIQALDDDSTPDTGVASIRKESTLSPAQLKLSTPVDVEDLIAKYVKRRAAFITDYLRSAMAGRFSWPLSDAAARAIYPNYSNDERTAELDDQMAGAVAALRQFTLGDAYAQAYLATSDTKWNARSVALLGDPQHPGGDGDAMTTLKAVSRSLNTAINNYKPVDPEAVRETSTTARAVASW